WRSVREQNLDGSATEAGDKWASACKREGGRVRQRPAGRDGPHDRGYCAARVRTHPAGTAGLPASLLVSPLRLAYYRGVTQPFWEFPVALPRNAFSARDAARAGDLWRAFQEVAVGASTRAGWSARRFSEAGTAFVVRTMSVRHARETYYGEPLHARTWVCRFR